MPRKKLLQGAAAGVVLIFAGAAVGLGDSYERRGTDEVSVRVQEELAVILAESGDARVGELTVNELFDLAGRLSVRQQEGEYIQRQKRKSFFLPGLGQFTTGDPLPGTLFLGGHLAIKAGTWTGAYLLLPDEVRIGGDGLDYINDSRADISEAWSSLSLRDLAPSFGVLLGGAIVNTAYRFWASNDAGRRATRNIDEGVVQFDPQPIRFVGDQLGFGASLRY